MSRPARINVPGTYYIIQRGSKYGSIFLEQEDYARFEALLSVMLNERKALLHAYCWTPKAIHLLLQVETNIIGRFMQGLTSAYARQMNRRLGGNGHFFQERHSQMLIEPATYLLQLINYIHHVPVLEGVVSALDVYPHTSHQAYLGVSRVPWLHTATARAFLANGSDHQVGYWNLMSEAPPLQLLQLFEPHGRRKTPRILGSADFLSNLPRPLRPPRRHKTSLDQITSNVAALRGVRREFILSKSRVHEYTLARAMIAWYATERGVATLSEVARYLSRDPSTLSCAITRYRSLRPELFTPTMFHPLAPIGEGYTGGVLSASTISTTGREVSATHVSE